MRDPGRDDRPARDLLPDAHLHAGDQQSRAQGGQGQPRGADSRWPPAACHVAYSYCYPYFFISLSRSRDHPEAPPLRGQQERAADLVRHPQQGTGEPQGLGHRHTQVGRTSY